MHNKTDRFGVPLKSQTTDLVGPTTYTVICKTQLQNRVPFLSTAKLKPTFFNKTFCNTFYKLPEDTKSKQLGCSPSNKSARTFNYDTSSPGPSAHYVKEVKCFTHSDMITEGQRVKKLYICRVPYTLVGAGPSIPTKLNANGYKVGPYGDVTPIPPIDHDTTLGPAFYSTIQKSNYDKKYRGMDLSRGRTKRDFYNADLNIPGPADYDVKMPACSRDAEGEKVREMARLFTFVPRSLEKQEMLLRSNNYPGPGDYDINKGNICKICPPLVPTAFSSRSKRFKYDTCDTPSATAYCYKPTKYNVSKLGIPFAVGSSRFANKKSSTTPGPADYFIKGPLSEKLWKNLEYAGHQPPFSKSAPRVTIEMSKDALSSPSPQDYTIECDEACKLYPTSMFRSKVPRFKKSCKTLYGAPALYDDMRSFKAVHNKKSHNALNVSFNAKSPKKGLHDSSASYNTSPASYETAKGLERKGFIVPKSPRWKEPKDIFPGPGSYLIHPSHRISMYNAYKTHNLLMKEDVLKLTLRCHPKTTWAKWACELKKNKKVRWFVNEGKGYVHCQKDLAMYKS